MVKRNEARQRIVDIARQMPPLVHKQNNEDFDIRKSRTLWWLTKQPEVLSYIWDIVKQSGAVEYDRTTGKWKGVDFEMEDDGE